MYNYIQAGRSKQQIKCLIVLLVLLVSCAGAEAQYVIPQYYVGVVYVHAGDSNDAARWHDTQEMVRSLNEASP